MFFAIFISFKQSRNSLRMAGFCKGSADCFKVLNRCIDFMANAIIPIIPIIHRMNKITPILEGAFVLIAILKSFIQFSEPGE